MHNAFKTKDLRIISYSMNGVIKSDKIFTGPGVVLITFFGLYMAFEAGYPILRTGWIFWSIILFTISGLIYGIKVAPLQKKIYKLSFDNIDNSNFNWSELVSLYRQWEYWGLAALLTPVAATVLMTLKLPL